MDSRTLLIDIGNTNLKWSWLQDGRRSSTEAAPYRDQDIAILCRQIWGDAPPPSRILLASVSAEAVNQGLEAWCQQSWNLIPEPIRSQASAYGVKNGYTEPERLGVDRWLTLIAMRHQTQDMVCIVDCGTAATIDVMDGQGRHLGGLILPGFTLMREALQQRTQLPSLPATDYQGLLATNTVDAVNGGALQATAALIERVMQEMETEQNQTPRLIITGSDAQCLEGLLQRDYERGPDLIMAGLAVIAQWENT